MGLLDELTGGGDRQADVQDFVGRYEEGAPYDNVDDQEAFDRHQQIAGELSPDEYEQSAQEALQNMSPEDRMAFGSDLEAQANANGLDLGSLLGGLGGGGLGGLGGGGLDGLGGQNRGMLAGLLGPMQRQNQRRARRTDGAASAEAPGACSAAGPRARWPGSPPWPPAAPCSSGLRRAGVSCATSARKHRRSAGVPPRYRVESVKDAWVASRAMATPRSGARPGARSLGDRGERRRKRGGWLWWLLGLLALLLAGGLLLGLLSRGDNDAKKSTSKAAGTAQHAPSAGAGAAAGGALSVGGTSLLPPHGDLSKFAGQDATGKDVVVQSVVAESGFWVGTSKQDRVFVEYGAKAGGNEEGKQTFKPEVGQKVNLTGPVRPAPQDPGAALKISDADAQLVKQQGAYINADSVKPAR